jgi:hypothetical protein
MAVATSSKKRKLRKTMARQNKFSLGTLLPLVVGILVTPPALHFASVLALSGLEALTMLYPWVSVVKSPVLRMGLDTSIPQGIMYLQFPLYGLIMTWISRSKPFGVALLVVVFIHAAGIGLAGLLSYLQGAPLKIF